jgi:hypothetical protein
MFPGASDEERSKIMEAYIGNEGPKRKGDEILLEAMSFLDASDQKHFEDEEVPRGSIFEK